MYVCCRRMLEKQEKRKITLVEVMNTCRIEAICAKQDARHEPQQLSPCTNCTVSTQQISAQELFDEHFHF